MKNILLILIIVLTTSFTSMDNNDIVEARVTYSGQSDKAYYFTKDTGKVLEFSFVSKKAISQYDLSAKQLIGKEFTITYEIDNIEIVSKDTQVKQFKKRLILVDIKEIESKVADN